MVPAGLGVPWFVVEIGEVGVEESWIQGRQAPHVELLESDNIEEFSG